MFVISIVTLVWAVSIYGTNEKAMYWNTGAIITGVFFQIYMVELIIIKYNFDSIIEDWKMDLR